MTKEQYLKLKDELKALAIQIKGTKSTHKSNQREFSKIDCAYNPNRYYWMTDREKKALESIRIQYEQEWARLYSIQYNSINECANLRREYRIKHIIYCLARGRTIQQIEPKIKDIDVRNDVYTAATILAKEYDMNVKLY